MTEDIIQFHEFALVRDAIPIFTPISANIGKGEIVTFIGQNGVGKSSLLQSLAGYQRSGITSTGKCAIKLLRASANMHQRARSGIMLVRQMPTVYTGLTVLEQILVSTLETPSFFSALSRIFKVKNDRELYKVAYESLDMTGLSGYADRSVAVLSVGQRRLLAMSCVKIRLALGKLRILLLDEPASGLDKKKKEVLRNLLDEVRTKGVSVLVAEHIEAGNSPLGERTITLLN